MEEFINFSKCFFDRDQKKLQQDEHNKDILEKNEENERINDFNNKKV